MSRYETDDEQVEALKKWWNQNGTSLLSTVLVAVIAWSGWTYYQTDKHNKAVEGSTLFEFMQMQMQQGAFAEVARQGLDFMEKQPESPYAAGIALMQAKYQYDKGEVEQAKTHLSWVIEKSTDVSLSLVASLRLVNIEIDNKNYDAAQAALTAVDATKLSAAEKANLTFHKAQLALAKQEVAAAKEALQSVVDGKAADVNLLNLAQLQLDDLAE